MHASLVVAGSAWLAYSSPASYAQPAVPEGGGGGRWFTGSPRDGYDCAVCHGGGEPQPLHVEGLPRGAWSPGLTYELTLTWPDPTADVSVLLEFTDREGNQSGELALAPEALLAADERCGSGLRASALHELDEGRTIVALPSCGASRLRLQWTAPEQASDAVWLFVAGVHADGSDSPRGDGVMVERIELVGPALESSGCSVGETSPRGGLLVLAWIGAWLLRRRGAACLMLGVLGSLAACTRVQPYERERLAAPDMQLELEPELCAGRNHAVEYREGSAGAAGGGGGGCGCN